jgi:hypothetical protein
MKTKRLSSLTTFWYAWILPMIFLPFWTVVSVFICTDYYETGITIYIFFATLILWIIYFYTKPWRLRQIRQGDGFLIFKDKGKDTIISYKQIIKIDVAFMTKISPIMIEYIVENESKKIFFIPRQGSVLFLFPLCKHPMVKELNEDINEQPHVK